MIHTNISNHETAHEFVNLMISNGYRIGYLKPSDAGVKVGFKPAKGKKDADSIICEAGFDNAKTALTYDDPADALSDIILNDNAFREYILNSCNEILSQVVEDMKEAKLQPPNSDFL